MIQCIFDVNFYEIYTKYCRIQSWRYNLFRWIYAKNTYFLCKTWEADHNIAFFSKNTFWITIYLMIILDTRSIMVNIHFFPFCIDIFNQYWSTFVPNNLFLHLSLLPFGYVECYYSRSVPKGITDIAEKLLCDTKQRKLFRSRNRKLPLTTWGWTIWCQTYNNVSFFYSVLVPYICMMYRLKKQKRVRPIHSKLKPHGQQFSNDDKNKIVTPLFCSSKIFFSKLDPCKWKWAYSSRYNITYGWQCTALIIISSTIYHII